MKEKILSMELFELTSKFIHNFYSQKINLCFPYLDDDFVWIGAFDFGCTHGKQEFISLINKQQEKDNNVTSIDISHDHYTLISHNANLWIIEAFFNSSRAEKNCYFITKTRCTFIWKRKQKNWLLIHLHTSFARDVPLIYDSKYDFIDIDKYSSWFQFVRDIDHYENHDKRIAFVDIDGITHFLLPSEILYVEVNDKLSTIYTFGENIIIRSSLRDILNQGHFFIQVHKRYLVNNYYVKSIKRYEISLVSDIKIPVSQKNYLEIKNFFTNTTQ